MGWKAIQDEWEELGGPPGGPGWVGRPSRRAGWGREGRERLGVPPGGLGELGDPSKDLGGAWRDERDWEALPEVQKGSEGSPSGLGGVESPY